MNTSGQRVAAAMRRLEAAFESKDIVDAIGGESLVWFLAAGNTAHTDLQAITHGEMRPADFDVEGMREWLARAWAIEGDIDGIRMGMADGLTAQEAAWYVELGRWMNQSGLSEDHAIHELARRLEAGEPMPWETEP
ncbi:MAG TPA: hypothetical protein VHZ31_00795 [Solirubrobacteraceae bacterium]|jgi:hypothetical protein|nr:hypothetical protein [Solirubrobacteraceae bacterium]